MRKIELTAGEIAGKIGGEIYGNAGHIVSGISDLKGAGPDDISFVLAPKYKKDAETSAARVIIADEGLQVPGKTMIAVKNARLAYVAVINIFHPKEPVKAYISPSASVDPAAVIGNEVEIAPGAVVGAMASIGQGTVIGAGVIIGEKCIVGTGTVINANVVLYPGVKIGNNCIIHSGVVIGADGFGFIHDGNSLIKVPQIGSVRIGNNVEIGANSCIDRAAFGETVIHDNVKIDNLVQIAHNCKIGDSTIVVAQAGIAGSTTIGRGCIIGGQVGIVDHVTIGDGVKIGSQAGIAGNLEPGAMVTGTPARPIIQMRKAEAYMMKLEDLFKRVKTLEEELKKNNK